MAISVYPDVRTAVWDLLDIGSGDMSTAKIDVILASVEDKLYRKLRVRQMETALSSTIGTDGTLALPSSYLELKYAYLDGSPTTKLGRKSAEWIYQNYPTRSSDGKPKFIGREASNFVFGPFPDSQYLVKGLFYQEPTAVAGSSSALAGILASAPYLWVFAGAYEVDKALGRKTADTWLASFNDLMNTVVQEDDREDYSGSPLNVTNA